MRFCGSGGFSASTPSVWVEEALDSELAQRDARWSEALAVGSLAFVEKIKSDLGTKAAHRSAEQAGATTVLREQSEAYGVEFAGENSALRAENTVPWQNIAEIVET
jgi:hypothetical protein